MEKNADFVWILEVAGCKDLDHYGLLTIGNCRNGVCGDFKHFPVIVNWKNNIFAIYRLL